MDEIKQNYLKPESEYVTMDIMRAFVSSSMHNLNQPMRVQSGQIQSSNYVADGDGWQLTATTAFLPNITLSGGTIKYQKTSFTDSAHSGYWIGSDGFYFGSVSDTSYVKYNIGTEVLEIKSSITITGGSGLANLSDTGDLALLSVIGNAYITDLAVSKLTAGSITSKAITLAVAAGTGDAKIQAGKTDFGDDTNGFILGIDDSDSDKVKFEIGEATHYLKYDPTDHLRIKGNIDVIGGDAYDKIESNLPSDENLVGYWAFDEGQGNKAYDGSGNNNTGTLNNMEEADWVDGVAGSALNFDGTAEYVTIPDPAGGELDTFSTMTITAWIYLTEYKNYPPMIVSKADDYSGVQSAYHFGIRENPYNYLTTWTQTENGGVVTFGSDVIPLNTWTFVTMVYDGANIKIYVDGEFDRETDQTGTIIPSTASVKIANLDGRYFPGKIDEVRIYDTALTAKEIYALYKNPSGQPSMAVPMGRLTSGTIYSKQITLSVAAGTGDSYLGIGTFDAAAWTATGGVLIGVDDSDSDKEKLFIGDATNSVDWNVTTLNTLTVKGTIQALAGYIGGSTNGWAITTGYIKSTNGDIELKGTATAHFKAIDTTDTDTYIQMTAIDNTPRIDIYKSNTGAKLRLRLNKDGLYFYDANAVEKARLYASTDGLELADTFALKKRLLSSSPADHGYVGNLTTEIQSGATVAAFQLVYLGTGGKWLLCDSDAIASSGGMLGIALEAKNDTQAMLVALAGTFIRDDSWNWTIGATLYAGETAGSMQEAIPTGADGVIRVVGWAISADVIWFFPSSDNSTVVA